MALILALFSDAVMAGGAGARRHVAVATVSVIPAIVVSSVIVFSVFFAIAFVIQALNARSATNADVPS